MREEGFSDPTPYLVHELALPLEANLPLGRMDVHVHPIRFQLERENPDREPGPGEVVDERRADGLGEGPGGNRATVHGEVEPP